MVRLTPNGLSVSERQRAISFVRSSGVGCVSAVMNPSAPALATAATSSARPTHCMPPCTIGCSTPTSSVNRVVIIPYPYYLCRSPDAAQRVALAERCAAEPGPSRTPACGTVPALRSGIRMPHRVRETARGCRRPGQMSTGGGVYGRRQVSALAGMAPGFVPVLAGCVDDAAVGFEELVRHLEDCEHQAALRTPGDMAAALFSPDEFAGLALDALRRTFLVDQAALEHIGLLDVDVLVVGQHRARRKAHQGGHQAGGAIEQQRLGLAAWEAGLLPFHGLGADQMGMRFRGVRALRRHGVRGDPPCTSLADPNTPTRRPA